MYVYGTQGNISVARATVTNNSLYILSTEEGGDWISDEGGKEIFKHLAEHYNVNLPEHWDARRITPETVEAGMILKCLGYEGAEDIKVVKVTGDIDSDGDRKIARLYGAGDVDSSYILDFYDYVLVGTFDPTHEIELPTEPGVKFSTELTLGTRWYDLMVTSDGNYVVLEPHNSRTGPGFVLPKEHIKGCLSTTLRIKEILSV